MNHGELSVKVSIHRFFNEENHLLEKCKTCNDMIFSKSYRLYVSSDVNGLRKKAIPTQLIVCESCYEAIENKFE